MPLPALPCSGPREVCDESPGTGLIKISLCQREINFCLFEMRCGEGKGSSRGRPVTALQGGVGSYSVAMVVPGLEALSILQRLQRNLLVLRTRTQILFFINSLPPSSISSLFI